jgi:hypothetical protein
MPDALIDDRGKRNNFSKVEGELKDLMAKIFIKIHLGCNGVILNV